MPSKNALDFLLLKLFNYGESDTMKPKIKEAAEILRKTIDDLAGTGVHVITSDDMTREEKEMELYAGFLMEGYTPEQAEKKAREFVEIAELAQASKVKSV